jgi:hypothetical protein
MALQELTDEKIKGRQAIGRPTTVTVPFEGESNEVYSDRVRRMICATAPEGSNAFVVGNSDPMPFQTEVKIWGSIIGRGKFPIRTELQTWYSHPVQYFN